MKKEVKKEGGQIKNKKRNIILIIYSIVLFCVIGMVVWLINCVTKEKNISEAEGYTYGVVIETRIE